MKHSNLLELHSAKLNLHLHQTELTYFLQSTLYRIALELKLHIHNTKVGHNPQKQQIIIILVILISLNCTKNNTQITIIENSSADSLTRVAPEYLISIGSTTKVAYL